VDLSFPVDISIPANTSAPVTPEVVGRPFDDLLEDGLALALAAAPGIAATAPGVAASVDGMSLDTTTGLGAPLPGIEALSAGPSGQIAGDLIPVGAPTDTVATGTGDSALPIDATGTTVTSTTATSTTATSTTDLVGTAVAAAGGAIVPEPAAATASNPETASPTAATNQALAIGSVAPRTLDPARVALTAQITRSFEESTNTDSSSTSDSTIADTVGGATDAAADPSDARQGAAPGVPSADAAAVGADTPHRSGSGEGHQGTRDAGVSGSDTLASFATDKVRYLRDLAPAREIQRLAIDLDDARVAVRFADGAATVDVMSDPSSRLDTGWVSNVEKTLRQLDRPVEPTTPGDQSQSQDRRDREDADSRRHDRPQHEQPQPSIDDERVRRWQDATRALMTTPNTRN
jgi:hypothetical protein